MGYHLASDIAQDRNGTFGHFPVTPKTHTPGPRLQGLGHRYYSPSLGRWISKDPLGERGGRNSYAMVRNNPVMKVDVLGLLPGFQNCAFSSTPTPTDTGWTLKTFIPTEPIAGNGGTYSPRVTCIFTRTIASTYVCPCCHPNQTRTIIYEDTAESNQPSMWWSPAGPWPPWGVGDVIGGIINGIIFPPMTDPEGAAQIASGCTAKLSALGAGMIASDSGNPRVWCWW